MEYERRKLLQEMSTKLKPNKKTLNTMAAVAATKEPEYFDEEGKKREPTLRILSLGAGVQSSCLALMAQEGLTKHKPDYMIFADTGWEPSFVYDPLITVERSNIREDLIRAANPIKGSNEEHKSFAGRVPNPPLFAARPGGKVGMLYRQCTHDYKVIPIQKKMREILGVKPRHRVKKGTIVEQWIGISTDEAMRMKKARMPWLTSRWPLRKVEFIQCQASPRA
jgi:3'-phosphoadenosine 5'-phosphosulfate sulfotransferase (PAPS reductase)/FAD synthetase